MFNKPQATILLAAWLAVAASVPAEEIGSVDTRLRPLSPDDSIKIEAFADPDVPGVVCYLSRAQIGGYGGALGLAEDTSDASIDCKQVGPISITRPFKPGSRVYRERRSLVFKSLRVIRFCDVANNAIVYLAYSERLVDGSPKNSVSAVPIARWPGQSQSPAVCRYE
jgi:CreA protein